MINVENINDVVGDAFEDLSVSEMVQSQGIGEIGARTSSTPVIGSAGLSFNITWNVSNAIFRPRD